YKRELEENGYTVIDNVLTEDEVKYARECFDEWLNDNEQIKKIHDKISPRGILKHLEVGHQRHAWYIRTRPQVQEVFENLWNTDDLVVSFDGSCWIRADTKKRDGVWTHTDQAPNKKGLTCYQGFVALTENVHRSLVVYEGSHKLHEEYAKEKNLKSSKNWLLIEQEYLNKIHDMRHVVHAKAGSLVLWDSRTFHQNQYGGKCNEERIVQYVSFLPRSGLTKKMYEKRKDYFIRRRTTSHWAYPVKVNGLQPQNDGNKELEIDYSLLKPPDLDDMMDDILKIL
ncbi:phytanoyl-CoA dioxygenase family protein, partial [Flavobacterium sp.]|uniref:phytanoyl-CoA dioxygenase family protein n=1 Tax=Flavobacterium sp. TaxID=239 RepID=UPI0037C0B878